MVVSRLDSLKDNYPENRKDFNKWISNVTINNYLWNMKVFLTCWWKRNYSLTHCVKAFWIKILTCSSNPIRLFV